MILILLILFVCGGSINATENVNNSNSALSINDSTIIYPDGKDSAIASSDWLTLNLDLTLPDMQAGDVATLSIGNDDWNYSTTSFIVDNYKITPEPLGTFKVEALQDAPTSIIDININLQYKNNIAEEEEKSTIQTSLAYENEVSTKATEVSLVKYKDFVDSKELLKKVSLGTTSSGNAAWVIFWNYNNFGLFGTPEDPFIFTDTPSEGQSIVKDSIAAYNVNNTVIDDTRNLDHDDYNYEFSSFLQGYTSDTSISISEVGNNIFNDQSPNNAYYIYFETTLPNPITDEKIYNSTHMESASNTDGKMVGDSEAELILPKDNYGTSLVNISVTKIWDDNNNQYNARPNDIKVQLYMDGVALGEPVSLNENNLWKTTWYNLQKKQNSNDILYSVDEINVPNGYAKNIDDSDKSNIIITNKYAMPTSSQSEPSSSQSTSTDTQNTITSRQSAPKTGDPTNMIFPTVTLFAALFSLIFILIKTLKNQNIE